MSQPAIEVAAVYKDFLLPHEKVGSLKGIFTQAFKSRDKTIERQHALSNISFEVREGEFFGIVGRNGSGKSTLLKILAGIYQPTKGSVRYRGKLVPFIELGVGFNPELTGRENVYLNGAMLGFSQKRVDAMYDDIVEFAELSRFMDKKLKNYSSGMQVRLAFSMATRSEADILLVDEVLAVGDADFQRKCFKYFMELKKNKKTVVFVTHDMNAVREYCDRAMLIEDSKIVSQGPPDKIATLYSQMFTKITKSSEQNDDGKRWGDGAVTYKNFTVNVVSGPNGLGSAIVIKARAIANQTVEKPNFGFLIKNSGGTSLLGTNSHIKKQYIDQLNKGEVVELVWELDNILNDGTYYVDPAITYGLNVNADWWEEAGEFTVYKEEKTHYPVNPDISLRITQIRSKKGAE